MFKPVQASYHAVSNGFAFFPLTAKNNFLLFQAKNIYISLPETDCPQTPHEPQPDTAITGEY